VSTEKFYVVEREDRDRGWKVIGYFREESARSVAREIRTFEGAHARVRPATSQKVRR
jgi:hypothetical protein